MKKSVLLILLTIITLNMNFSVIIVNGEDQEVVFTEIAQTSTEGRTDFVEIVNNFAYIFDLEEGFFVYDIHNPWEPKLLDSLSYDNYADFRVHGGHDFVIQESTAIINFIHSGIKIVDIEDPSNLEVIGSYDSGGEYYYIDVVENLIYCAKSTDGLEILDISTPSSPVKVGDFSNDHGLYQLQIKGQIAYINDFDQKRTICLNISDSSNVTELNQLEWQAGNIVFVDEIGYIGYSSEKQGLGIYNFNDPIHPVLLSELYDGGKVYDIKIREEYLFIADHADGVEIINVQDPENPVEVAQWNDGGECRNLDITNNLMIIAEGFSGWKNVLIEGLDLGEITSITKSTPSWTIVLPIFTLVSLEIVCRKNR
ncbi:MAG: LVIVD repeat-containing protein [Candidatus Hodarchaeales archaeon]|jgi:hypothetical protein